MCVGTLVLIDMIYSMSFARYTYVVLDDSTLFLVDSSFMYQSRILCAQLQKMTHDGYDTKVEIKIH